MRESCQRPQLAPIWEANAGSHKGTTDGPNMLTTAAAASHENGFGAGLCRVIVVCGRRREGTFSGSDAATWASVGDWADQHLLEMGPKPDKQEC